ncbi:FAD/NAD(P)-binding protein [Novosphingobium sp.]|uniref:FAD/NAD(P)-binding protein n=1 Tax=Novosphingobium sp. TaxID=1874826 RepID=UPI003B52063D
MTTVRTIALIGSGPMAIYTLKHLITHDHPLDITVFEASDQAGLGMPYNPQMNADYMLCNAFSREIPPPVAPLIDWLKHLPERELSEWELSYHDLSARAFYPRVLIGEYLQSQFQDLCDKARAAGHTITVRTKTAVSDIVPDAAGGADVHWRNSGSGGATRYDAVVIASGHSWPRDPQIEGVPLISPWPYTRITQTPGDRIGILGSSLSAVDVVVALGHARGRFEDIAGEVTWLPNNGEENLSIAMVSHMGVMPEGDFYYPFPYGPAAHLTADAVAGEVAKGTDGLLDRVFALLLAELDEADPAYLDSLAPGARTIEGFAPAYFALRHDLGGLRAVRRDRVAARESIRRKETVPHRYVLLRGHEVFDDVLRDLSDADYQRFRKNLLPVFSDSYAAIPHLSLARIIALYEAGVLSLLATGTQSEFSQDADGTISVQTEDGPVSFDAMIDARGQSPASLSALPFQSLAQNLEHPDRSISEPFQLDVTGANASRIYCLALPQLLERYPFTQGLVDCAEHARALAGHLLDRGVPEH